MRYDREALERAQQAEDERVARCRAAGHNPYPGPSWPAAFMVGAIMVAALIALGAVCMWVALAVAR